MLSNTFSRASIMLALFFLISQAALAQENYLPGYLISINGDTINGLIDYQNWSKNPKRIHFKEGSSENEKSYLPIEIKAFGVAAEIYTSAIVETEVSPFTTNQLEDNSRLNIKVDTVFLQLLIRGEKSLFFHQNELAMKNFYVLHEGELKLLGQKKYMTFKDGKRGVAENKQYVGQLTLFFQDCPKIYDKVQQITYSQKSLEKIFISYLSCTESVVEFQKKTEKITTAFGPMVGIGLTTFNFQGGDGPILAGISTINLSQSINPSGGLFFEIIFPRNRQKLSLVSELLYTAYQVEGTSEQFASPTNYTTHSIDLDYSYAKLNLLFRYKYPLDAIDIFANVGFSNGYAFTNNSYQKKEIVNGGIEVIREDSPMANFSKYEQGLIIGLGSRYKSFSFEARYDAGNGMSRIPTLQSRTNRLSVLVGYRL